VRCQGPFANLFLYNRDHIAELNSARPKQPFFFLKPSTSILLPGEGPVIRPRGVDLHYEVELALILGKQVKNLEATDEKGAMDAVESTFDQSFPHCIFKSILYKSAPYTSFLFSFPFFFSF
jgi:2-keto-4-pentenoate hydratase/2-oxohepta-3-ene-1,7-dioic acid hydratase in catechol pathway